MSMRISDFGYLYLTQCIAGLSLMNPVMADVYSASIYLSILTCLIMPFVWISYNL